MSHAWAHKASSHDKSVLSCIQQQKKKQDTKFWDSTSLNFLHSVVKFRETWWRICIKHCLWVNSTHTGQPRFLSFFSSIVLAHALSLLSCLFESCLVLCQITSRRFAHFFNICNSGDRCRLHVDSLQNLLPLPFDSVSCCCGSTKWSKFVWRGKMITSTIFLCILAAFISLDSSQ